MISAVRFRCDHDGWKCPEISNLSQLGKHLKIYDNSASKGAPKHLVQFWQKHKDGEGVEESADGEILPPEVGGLYGTNRIFFCERMLHECC